MKPIEPPEPGVFSTGTSISDSESWITSILRQLRERKADANAPQVEITAQPDPDALGRLLETPSSFTSLIASIRASVSDWLHPRKIETTATPLEVEELWEKDNSGYSGLISIGVHVALIAILLVPFATRVQPPDSTETSVMLLSNTPLILNLPKDGNTSGGGGGGGMRTPTPPSKGVPPRGADKQLTPPVVEAKNLHPELIVEPTVVAVQLQNMPQFNFNTIGDINGIVGPPSAGPGTGGGIGTGTGTGVGEGRGAGVGPGEGGGIGGGVYAVGTGISEPRILYQPQPEYSEDGRRARAQGSVELSIIVKADGTVDFKELTKRLGYGLDQKAIDAVKKWKFAPAKKDGQPVAVYVSVLVNFSLR